MCVCVLFTSVSLVSPPDIYIILLWRRESEKDTHTHLFSPELERVWRTSKNTVLLLLKKRGQKLYTIFCF